MSIYKIKVDGHDYVEVRARDIAEAIASIVEVDGIARERIVAVRAGRRAR